MGVHGVTRFLQEKGILLKQEGCCSSSLWRQHKQQKQDDNDDDDEEYNDWIRQIPIHSTLLIDGNGLAFYLFDKAYARHLRALSNKSSSNSPSCPKINQLMQQQETQKNNSNNVITQCVPIFVPLELLSQVTKEFILTLIDECQFKLHLYWDGPLRRFKTLTDQKRLEQREYEWNMLQQYCCYGVLPATNKSNNFSSSKQSSSSICQWKVHFPNPGLFLEQVRCTIQQLQLQHNGCKAHLQMIYCKEEADVELAKACSLSLQKQQQQQKASCFVVGQDSDFLFYKDIQYIPFNSICIGEATKKKGGGGRGRNHGKNNNKIKRRQCFAHVYTRSKLEIALDLLNVEEEEHDDDDDDDDNNDNSNAEISSSLLIEFAILLGNDYINPKTISGVSRDPESILTFLRTQKVGYQVHALEKNNFNNNHDDVQNALRFVRALYDLKSLNQFPLDDIKSIQDEKRCIPNDFPIELLKLKEEDSDTTTTTINIKIQNILVQALQVYITNNQKWDDDTSSDRISQDQLDTYKQAMIITTATTTNKQQQQRNTKTKGDGNNTSTQHNKTNIKMTERPRWNDIIAADLIERCIRRILKSLSDTTNSSSSSSGSQHNNNIPSPDVLFNHIKFHSTRALNSKKQEQDKKPEGPNTETTTAAAATPKEINDNNKTNNNRNKSKSPTRRKPKSKSPSRRRRSRSRTQSPKRQQQSPQPQIKLPIDEHESNILETIKNNRVTIIHGETGCGKSSRVPIMILKAEPPEPEKFPDRSYLKMFISQPRRIAAKALVERVRSTEAYTELHDAFALRMGHGWREYESPNTQAWFVTAGYLTRLLANHPERFDTCSHLIIDEVHERSVDTDILCLLCRRLLQRNKTIRLVLMSATLATKLYQDYFGNISYTEDDDNPVTTTTSIPPTIHVGVRRYPIRQYFVEDFSKTFPLPSREAAAAIEIQKECDSSKCKTAPYASGMTRRFQLAAYITSVIGRPGSSVVIFVPGMQEIIAITELIERLYVVGTKFVTYPIHSDIPFEDQMAAFDAPGPNEVKVVIATNAAESSVTLPDVDHVICLGLCRQIMYNASSHRQVLVPCWISRASATQRAGRTGRVRPGNVYRLYTKDAYDKYMDEFEPGEMVRIPLDHVILMLKQLLHEEVTPALLDCIEPPNIDTIDRSFESLFKWDFLTEPNDLAEITTLGNFVSTLGIDLSLGFLIGLGIQFGLAAEVIEIAAILSFPKSPFYITNPLIHEPEEYNDKTSSTFVSKCHFDAMLYSEPFALMNCIWDYDIIQSSNNMNLKWAWCKYYSIAWARMKQLVSTRDSIRVRVSEFLGIDKIKLQLETPPAHMPPTKIHLLRILQVWVFSDTLIEFKPPTLPPSSNSSGKTKSSSKATTTYTMPIPAKGANSQLEEYHLDQVLDRDRHPYRLCTFRTIEQVGEFEYNNDDSFCFGKFAIEFEKRLISYISEKDIPFAWCFDENEVLLYIQEVSDENENETTVTTKTVDNSAGNSSRSRRRRNRDNSNKNRNITNSNKLDFLDDIMNDQSFVTEESLLIAEQQSSIKTRRGIFERTCGMWSLRTVADSEDAIASIGGAGATDTDIQVKHFRKYRFLAKNINELYPYHSVWMDQATISRELKALMSWNFSASLNGGGRRKKKGKKKGRGFDENPKFIMSMYGDSCKKISKQDLIDILSTGKLDTTTTKDESKQSIIFDQVPHKPKPYTGKENKKLATTLDTETSSWNQPYPLFNDIPEGARLLSVLASGQRRGDHVIRFTQRDDDADDNGGADGTNMDKKKKKASNNNQSETTDATNNTIAIPLKKHETSISRRWTRLDTDRVVYVNENTVPSSAMPTSRHALYACCANTLEVKGGGLRAEGLTLLPPNPLFLLLSCVSFGVESCIGPALNTYGFSPDFFDPYDSDDTSDEDEKRDNEQLQKIYTWMPWLRSRWQSKYSGEFGELPKKQVATKRARENEAIRRLRMAFEFHASCLDGMGEALICFPEKVKELCNVFGSASVMYDVGTLHNIDGSKKENDELIMSPWESLEERSLTMENITRWRYEKKQKRKTTISRETTTTTATSKNDRGYGSDGGDRRQKQQHPQQQQQHEFYYSSDEEEVMMTNKRSKKSSRDGNKNKQKDGKVGISLAQKKLMELINATYGSTTTPEDNARETPAVPTSEVEKGMMKLSLDNKTSVSGNNDDRIVESNISNDSSTDERLILRGVLVTQFPDARRMFATELEDGEEVLHNELASTNILSLLFKVYGEQHEDEDEGDEEGVAPDQKNKKTNQRSKYAKYRTMCDDNKNWNVALDKQNWNVSSFTHNEAGDGGDAPVWYQARFLNPSIPLQLVKGRGKNKLPNWIKRRQRRPSRVDDALQCIPVAASCNKPFIEASKNVLEAQIARTGRQSNTEHALLFSSIDLALRMEAAFWLEQQFSSCLGGNTDVRHWYDYTFEEMIQLLLTKPPPS